METKDENTDMIRRIFPAQREHPAAPINILLILVLILLQLFKIMNINVILIVISAAAAAGVELANAAINIREPG